MARPCSRSKLAGRGEKRRWRIGHEEEEEEAGRQARERVSAERRMENAGDRMRGRGRCSDGVRTSRVGVRQRPHRTVQMHDRGTKEGRMGAKMGGPVSRRSVLVRGGDTKTRATKYTAADRCARTSFSCFPDVTHAAPRTRNKRRPHPAHSTTLAFARRSRSRCSSLAPSDTPSSSPTSPFLAFVCLRGGLPRRLRSLRLLEQVLEERRGRLSVARNVLRAGRDCHAFGRWGRRALSCRRRRP